MNGTLNGNIGSGYGEEESKLVDLPRVWSTVLMSVMIVVFILTVVGNITVLIVLRYSDVLHKIVNSHLLVSLSIADLLVGILVMPCALYAVNTGLWRCGDIWGKFNGFGNFLFCISSIMHLMMLSIDRYSAISRPLFYPFEMTSTRSVVICFVCWMYSAFWAFLPLFGVSSYECFISYIGRCDAADWSKYGSNFVFAVSVVSGTYGLALFAMEYVYWKIALVIQSQRQRIAFVSNGPSANRGESDSMRSFSKSTLSLQSITRKINQYKGVITLLIVIAVYFICWSPFCFLLFYEIASGEKVQGPAGSVAMLVGFANSCCNPIIYSIKYKRFRTAVLRLLGQTSVHFDSSCFERKDKRIEQKRKTCNRRDMQQLAEASTTDLSTIANEQYFR